MSFARFGAKRPRRRKGNRPSKSARAAKASGAKKAANKPRSNKAGNTKKAGAKARPAKASNARKKPPRRAKSNRRKLGLIERIPDVKAVAKQLGTQLVARTKKLFPSVVTVTLIACVAVGAFVGYRWLTTSKQFAAKHIVVHGNDRVTATGVERSLAIPAGTNIFSIDLGGLERRLEADPWIKRASVTRKLPNTLRVDLTEHKAVAVVQMNGLYLANAEGFLFKRATIARGEGAGLPVITGIPRVVYAAHPESAKADIRRALDIAAAYRAGAKRPKLGEVHLSSRRNFTIFTYDAGLEIRVGRGNDEAIASRLRFFDLAWRTLDTEERARAQTIYVDNTTRPDRVTVAFRN